MSGTSGDEDDNAGKIFPPACPGYRYNFGGGKPLPPTVPLLQNAGALACSEQEAPCHHPVRQGGGKDVKEAGIGGSAESLERAFKALGEPLETVTHLSIWEGC